MSLEIKLSIEPTQPSRQRDEELRERRVHIHEELSLDVFGGESTEAGVQCQLADGQENDHVETYWTSSKTTLVG